MKSIGTIFLLFFLNYNFTYSQESDTLVISVDRLINTMSLESTAAKIQKINYKNEILEYENYKKSYLPSISLNLSPMNFNRSLRLIQSADDGSYSNIEDYTNNSSIGLTLRQKIGLTGGEVRISSNLNFLNEYSQKRSSFNTTPISISYSQKIFGSKKSLKFEKTIKYKKNIESIKQFCSSISNIQKQALNLFLNSFLANINYKLSEKNLKLANTLLNLAKIKLNNGRLTKFNYKQLELQLVNNKYSLISSLRNYDRSIEKMLLFLGISKNKRNVKIKTPLFNLPIDLDKKSIMFYINKNNNYKLTQEIKKLEAKHNLYQVKLQNSINASINVSYGLNQHAKTFTDAYNNTNSRQSIRIGVTIPIFQWGVNKNKELIAENIYQRTLLNIDDSNKKFENKIKTQLENYFFNVKLLSIAKHTYELSVDQYKLAVTKFEFGKISVYELNSIQKEQNIAMQKHYNAIKNVWMGYFEIRHITLHDFVHDKELQDIFINKKIIK